MAVVVLLPLVVLLGFDLHLLLGLYSYPRLTGLTTKNRRIWLYWS
uniref:Uncharacterized protein n=2 Tax=Picea TaxID=3328 RepID=A0A117NGU2_PICGL|nr:hypothetical protein ABT39_MTgene5516 [Picea glauca]QHR91582.1 hypothetical protein Q903MT_gene5617 [Picea sitchensis]